MGLEMGGAGTPQDIATYFARNGRDGAFFVQKIGEEFEGFDTSAWQPRNHNNYNVDPFYIDVLGLRTCWKEK